MSPEPNNLSRIRDNQRRSRARRKEYLQELEARLRQCENLGAEASVDIQLAARRVAEENLKLRELLAKNNIGREAVEAYLQGFETVRPPSSNACSVEALDELLTTRRICCGSTANSTESPIRFETERGDLPAHSSSPGGLRLSSITERSPEDRRLNIMQVSEVYNPVPGRNLESQSPPLMSQLPNLRDQGHQSDFGAELITPSMEQVNVNSCIFAADMITAMAGGEPNAVRLDLGCQPGVQGDCEVDNHLVFDVMDRYAGVVT